MTTAKMLLYFAVIVMGIVLTANGSNTAIRIMGVIQVLLAGGLIILKTWRL